MPPVVEHFRAMARNNEWSNFRLLRACARLSHTEFIAPRTSFFPSLQTTLNHILIVDWFYLDALTLGGRGLSLLARDVPYPAMAELAPAQRDSDRRLIAFCDALTAPALETTVVLERASGARPVETVEAVLSHLFVHQIHHRGQAHAMLAGTSVPPPQLDEFFLAEDAPLRAADLAELDRA